ESRYQALHPAHRFPQCLSPVNSDSEREDSLLGRSPKSEKARRPRLLRCDACARLIGAWNCTEANVETIGAIDRHDRERQVRQFRVSELGADLLIDFVRRMTLGDQRERLGPGQGGPLAL